MGLFSFLSRSSRDAPKDSLPGYHYLPWYGRSASNKNVTERTSMQIAAVYACVRVLSEAVAQLPLHTYQIINEGSTKKAYDHPLYRLLHDEPNPEMTSYSFRETMMVQILLWGNAYAQIIRNRNGEIIALYPLQAKRMAVDRDEKGRLYYQYAMTDEDPSINKVETVTLSPSEVLHIPGLGYDGLIGYSPIAMCKNAIGSTIAAEEYGSKFFANGATPSGILEYPGVLKDPESVRAAWNKGFSGSENANKVAVLEQGMKYTPISINPQDSQFLETRKFQVEEIARIFRVPPHMIGDLEHATFSNIEEQSLEFVTYSLQPWLTRWEQSIQKALFNEEEKKNYYVRFNVDSLLRADYASRMSGYATARQNGWMSANDIRKLENMDLIPEEEGGDLYLINGNMSKLKDAGSAYGAGASEGGEENKDDEEVLELEDPESGESDGEGRSERHGPNHRRAGN